jgi:hypothetical protein
MLLIGPISMLLFLALYAALRQVDESVTLIALALGLVAVTAMIAARPVFEIFTLFWVPVVGLMFLFLSMLGSVPWSILLGRDLFRLSKGK